jgi:hypothetical protein
MKVFEPCLLETQTDVEGSNGGPKYERHNFKILLASKISKHPAWV